MDDAAHRAEPAAPVTGRLEALAPGQAIVFGADRVTYVTPELAAAFRPGDRLIVVQETGDLLHVPAADQEIASAAVGEAQAAFAQLGEVSDAAVARFFEGFAARLADEAVWAAIGKANAADVAAAKARGRSVTRLAVADAMRADMVEGLQAWAAAPPSRGRVLERIEHTGWSVEQSTAALGVVGFVFEGRPNVFADAAGVIRGGNAVVFRIGSDALGTAKAVMAQALRPALSQAGLPRGAAVLVDSAAHAAGWALFADPRLSVAVARGSGPAVAQLGAIARQAGTPVSLHGTGGAWMIADDSANADRFFAAVFHSLDRKVCNTLNVCCIARARAGELVPVFLQALEAAGRRRQGCKLHVAAQDRAWLPDYWKSAQVTVLRAEGPALEPLVEPLEDADLGIEWEWEETPEVSLKIVDDLAAAIDLFNRFSPRFAASLIAEDARAQALFRSAIDAPFTGDGFTRWVDGQYALDRPELGLSNWQAGRLFARGAVLSGDGVFTVRTRASQTDPNLDRAGEPTPKRS